MRVRVAVVVVMVVAGCFTIGNAAWGDPAADNPGLTHVCNDDPGRAGEKNPHCDGGEDGSTGGGNGGATGGDGPTVQARLAECAGDVEACDDDADGTPDPFDECNGTKHSDGDGTPDACDSTFDRDADGDGAPDNVDNCPTASNPNQSDLDGNGTGDACDRDLPLDDRSGNDRPDEVDAAQAFVVETVGGL